MNLVDICGILVQDRAALKVAEYLNFDEAEGCDMHDGDKIGRSAIGELVRSKNKQIINPFPEGVKLIEKFQGIGKTFISTHANRIAYENILDKNPQLPRTVVKRDLNKTRISARQNLLYSALLIKKDYACMNRYMNLQISHH